MGKLSSNIIVGAPSTVIVAPYGVAEGGGTAVDLGSTEGGLKMTYTPEFYFAKADQWLGKVGAYKINEDMTIELTLAECTLANLAYAFGYPTSAVAGTVFYAGGNATATERTVYINGVAPGGGTSKITVHKCVIIGTPEVAMLKNDKTVLKVTLQVLQDTSQTANQQMISFEFSGTDTTEPTVAMTTPANKATWAVKTTVTSLVLTFTESDNTIDEGTLIYGQTIIINDVDDVTTPVLKAGTIVYNSATKTLIFTPTVAWTTAHEFVLMVTTAVRDTAGNHLASAFLGSFVID